MISDHGASKKSANPLWVTLHRYLWCTTIWVMIWELLDHWSPCGNLGKSAEILSKHTLQNLPCSRLPTVRVGKQNFPHCYVAKNLHNDPSWIKKEEKLKELEVSPMKFSTQRVEDKTGSVAAIDLPGTIFNSRGLLHALIKTTNQVTLLIYGREHCQSHHSRKKSRTGIPEIPKTIHFQTFQPKL